MDWDTTSASGVYRYSKDACLHVRRKLKSFFILKHEFDFVRDDHDFEEWEDAHRNWLINADMAVKFGDGNYYSFELCTDNDNYTHTHDGFYYHELWFEDPMKKPTPIMKLDEEDFIL